MDPFSFSNKSLSIFNTFFSFMDEEEPTIGGPTNDEYTEAHFIYQNIYLGSLVAANDYEWLKKNNITHVLGLIGSQYKYDGIKYLVVDNLHDYPSENILKYFRDSFTFIDQSLDEGGRVLIHCHAGISRSTTIVIGYLIYKYGMVLEDSFSLVKSIRNIIHPNYGFITQLKLFSDLSSEERKLTVEC